MLLLVRDGKVADAARLNELFAGCCAKLAAIVASLPWFDFGRIRRPRTACAAVHMMRLKSTWSRAINSPWSNPGASI